MRKIEFFFNFCKNSGIKTVEVKRSQDAYVISKKINAAALEHLSKKTLDTFLEYFGTDITIKIGINGGPLLIHIDNGKYVVNSKKDPQYITKPDGKDKFDFWLSISKTALFCECHLHSDVLLFFCKTIGIVEQEVKSPDTSLPLYNLNKDAPAANYKTMYIFALEALSEVFGKALTLTIKLGDRLGLLQISNGSTEDLEKSLENIDSHQTGELTLNLIIDKPVILKNQGLDNDLSNHLLFLFKTCLLRFLKKPYCLV